MIHSDGKCKQLDSHPYFGVETSCMHSYGNHINVLRLTATTNVIGMIVKLLACNTQGGR